MEGCLPVMFKALGSTPYCRKYNRSHCFRQLSVERNILVLDFVRVILIKCVRILGSLTISKILMSGYSEIVHFLCHC